VKEVEPINYRIHDLMKMERKNRIKIEERINGDNCHGYPFQQRRTFSTVSISRTNRCEHFAKSALYHV
jgi:hypothetical protein